MNVSRHHADWLSLVEVSGPFVSLPVLLRVFPQGLEPRDPAQAKVLRAAYDEWQDNATALGVQRAWVLHVLCAVLGYPQEQIVEGQRLPAGLEANMPEMGESLSPDFVLVGHAAFAGQVPLLISSYPAEQALNKPVIGKHWKASPATRMMELLHGANVQLGLVTNGEHWMLVYAPRGETTGYASWYGALWLDEPITLRAFHSLLGVRRFFGVAPDSTLQALLKDSANDQQEVTDQLGYQVREAVEVLVQSFDALDKESNRTLLKGVNETAFYEAALTVMMRLVFLFSAEERDLLHLGKPLYDDNYAVSTLREQLQDAADRYGEEVLERRYDAWARLLATFRGVHCGIQHQDLLMQAYGGSLFDPDRYPFLEGRSASSGWRSTAAEPLAVNNRVVLHLLNSMQRLRTKVGIGGTAETRRVSFRALGVEQIGHVYEGLLDHTAVRAKEPVLGMKGTRSKEPEVPLATLESLLAQGEDKLIEYLKEQTGRSVSALRHTLEEHSTFEGHKLLIACDQNKDLLARLRPFIGFIREDSFERPLVVLPGSVYVTAGTARRSTGTHYTPPSLTEPIVQHTLEPLVYEGPSEGWSRDQWKLKPPKAILDLKVCDMAMGSGAFLVQACRYLAERLVEAWENEERQHPGEVLITPDGKFSDGMPSERLVPADASERIAIARRSVADRCLYGVDINPMAVEMAKLSLWLVTVDRHRPFTFLDHAFKCGDSLLGITSLEQLENFSLRPGGGKQQAFATLNFWRHIDDAKRKREALEAMSSDTPEQIANKAALYAEADKAVVKLNAAADVLVGVELMALNGRVYEAEREGSADHMMFCWASGLTEIQSYASRRLEGRRCLHWPLAFPEITARGGFDAIVGNPPFVGGKKISGVLGVPYRDHLVNHLADGQRGSADLCVYFVLRSSKIVRSNGLIGLVTTNTISQGDTREVGLERLLAHGFTIPCAVGSRPWPGDAALEIAHLWLFKGIWRGCFYLDDRSVEGITAFLTTPRDVPGKPFRLTKNAGKSFQGSILLGMGFTLTSEQAAALIANDSNNADVVFKYINGEDLNARPDQSPSRWVINFFDWPLDRTADGHWTEASDSVRKIWLRDGRVPSDYPGPVAADYSESLFTVRSTVKPERDLVKREVYRSRWWNYAERQKALYRGMVGMSRVLATAQTSKYITVSISPTSLVFSNAVIVLLFEDSLSLGVLTSSLHAIWVSEYVSSLETRFRYVPTDCLETFPFPTASDSKFAIAERYHERRREIMLERQEGLTKTYNRFHDPDQDSVDIIELRRLHVELDNAAAAAYGWRDLCLTHGFHETKQGLRFTVSESARRELLDRLLTLNHQRHGEEDKKSGAGSVVASGKRGQKENGVGGQVALDL